MWNNGTVIFLSVLYTLKLFYISKKTLWHVKFNRRSHVSCKIFSKRYENNNIICAWRNCHISSQIGELFLALIFILVKLGQKKKISNPIPGHMRSHKRLIINAKITLLTHWCHTNMMSYFRKLTRNQQVQRACNNV